MWSRKAYAGVLAAALVASGAAQVTAASPARGGKAQEMIAARQRFFGKQNVDPLTGRVRPDRVILSWAGTATYAASFKGHVVLLDAWVARGSHSGYVPTSPSELAALDPESILVGHGDFDHAADVAEVATASGAVVVGTPEHCDSVRRQAEDGAEIDCKPVSAAGAPPGSIQEVDIIPGVDISAVVHLHSSVEAPETIDGGRLPCPPVWDPVPTVQHPPSPEDMIHLGRHLPDARGGNVLYQIRVGRFSLVHHDTTGKIDDNPLVTRALESLPETDVQFGAVLAFGQVTNCMRSLGLYVRALSPKVYAATHHDNFTWAIGANAESLEPYVRDELERIDKKDRPELLYSYDPKDYLRPELYTFDPKDPRWR